MNTPILFIIFNRPIPTLEVFQSIRTAKPKKLYISADGPRLDKEGEIEVVKRVREIALAVDWPCEIYTLFRDKNIGCQLAPREAIDWFFENEEYGIILEDDCLPSQSFFKFCEEMLFLHKDNKNIMAITGTNITQNTFFEYDYFFSRYPLMWGWASWRRAWSLYDPHIKDWKTLKRKNWLYKLKIGNIPFLINWTNIFDLTYKLKDNATWWDYQWIYCCWKNNGYTIAPSKNLVKNLGITPDATHTVAYDPIRSNLILNDLTWPLSHPIFIEINNSADEFISRFWFYDTWIHVIKVYLLSFKLIKFFNLIRHKISNRIKKI